MYMLLDKSDSFLVSIVRVSHIGSNISGNNFYSVIKGEFLRIASSTVLSGDFIPQAKMMLTHIESSQQFSIS